MIEYLRSAALAGGMAMVFAGCGGSDNRVLIINLENSSSESYGIGLFKKALKSGGQVAITIEEIRDSDPSFEAEYTISVNGSYFVGGALINYVVDHGWVLHELGPRQYVFKRA